MTRSQHFAPDVAFSRAREYRCEVTLASEIDEVFEFFSDAHNLERITPELLRFAVLTPRPIEMGVGTLIDYRLKLRGVPVRWRTRIAAWEPPHRFIDEQLKGPYRLWRHEHMFEQVEGGTRCVDVVRYAHWGGRLIEKWLVRPDIERIFAYRREQMVSMFGELGGKTNALLGS